MKNLLLSALAVMSLLLLFACGGSKPSSSAAPIVNDDAPMLETSKVDSLKQAAEAAEWEAHRLREELNRKSNAP